MSKFKMGDEKLYFGEWCKVERAVGQCYEMVFKGGDHRLIQECRLTPFKPASAETDRERRGRERYEQHCKHLHEAAPDISTLPWGLVQSYEKQSWGADAAEYPDRRELTNEDVERAAIAYVNARADSHNPNWYGSTETLRENVREYMRAALTTIGALPAKREATVNRETLIAEFKRAFSESLTGEFALGAIADRAVELLCTTAAKREPTEDEVERVAEAIREYVQPAEQSGSAWLYREAARLAIAAMSPREPLKAVTISDEELTKGIAGAWYGDEGIHTQHPAWERSARRARELLAANSAVVDFVVTAASENVGWFRSATLIPISSRAKQAGYETQAESAHPIDIIMKTINRLQHEGFVVLVR